MIIISRILNHASFEWVNDVVGKLGPALAVLAALIITVVGSASLHGGADSEVSPIFGVSIPDGYRSWELVGVAHETGLDELRGIVGNASAVKALKEETLPLPDGAVLVKLAWKHAQSPEFAPAFVPGAATTVQVMVKDSKRYSATGGWGFGRFVAGRPVDRAQHESCFACHEANVKDRDYVFTRFAR